jgi:uncharacterized protein YbdZ (MbtH family)
MEAKKMSAYSSDVEDMTIYRVVVNHEEQYSIWPEYKNLPLGWVGTGKIGHKSECLEYIKEVWTDMRPLGLRKKMEEMAKNPMPPPPSPDPNKPRKKSLVDRLCKEKHPVEVGLRPEKSTKLFKEAIDRNYVHIKFTDTKGGTELGISLDSGACDFSRADFENAKGTVHIEGELTLDFVKVRCISDVDLSNLKGEGYLLKK